jgi:hypothetical protein
MAQDVTLLPEPGSDASPWECHVILLVCVRRPYIYTHTCVLVNPSLLETFGFNCDRRMSTELQCSLAPVI